MKIVSTYRVKIKEYRHIFRGTVKLYRDAVSFYISLIHDEWVNFEGQSQKSAVNLAESLSVRTKHNPQVKTDFGERFYKFPSYLRRGAIAEAYGKVSSYMSNLKRWEDQDADMRGEKPSFPKAGYVYPALYKGNMYQGDIFNEYSVNIKVYRDNTWDWLTVQLKKSDVDYIRNHCKDTEQCVPTLMKRGKQWFLYFVFKKDVELTDTPIREQVVMAVDLGMNSSCTCSVLSADGTVLGRRFFRLPREYDSLTHKIGHIKRAQKQGSKLTSNLWRYAKGVNDDIAVKTANYIIDTAVLYDVDCIVFEHLDLTGKKSGKKKQKLHLWKARYVQTMVEHKAHDKSIHISHVNAWGTSRLAYDGSGMVKRGRESERCQSHSICEFKTGKIYNCDLNATYNIGARYFVREIMKTLPVTERQRIEVKIPDSVKRSTCTLSTLISLNGELRSVG